MLFSNTVLKYAPEPTQNVDKLSVQYKQSINAFSNVFVEIAYSLALLVGEKICQTIKNNLAPKGWFYMLSSWQRHC